MRVFVGIDLSDQLKEEILKLQLRLKNFALKGRWKHADNFHITLKFLGEVNKEKLADIDGKLREASQQAHRFKLKISELGSFPGREGIRVLWMGLGGEMDALNRLQCQVENKMADLGFQKEKRSFTPHITIGQDIYFDRSFNGIKDLINIEDFKEIDVGSIHLFKSEQIGSKRVYTSLFEHSFK